MATVNNIDIIVKYIDQATAGIKKTAGELESFAERNKATFQKMAGFGIAGFAGISAGIHKTTQAYQEQAKAEALVTRGFERVAETWKMTSQDLFDEASKLQKTSIFGDEEILQKVTNNLLTFGGVGEEVFNRAQRTALDLATTLEQDLQSSTIMLGKALEDPITGLSALSRVGIKFTEDQEDMIKSMAGAGDVLGAQTLMLEEIEKLYGGASQAAADALGPFEQLKKEMGDMSEVIGGALQPILDDLAENFRPVVENITNWIKKNHDLVKDIVIVSGVIAGLIAVLGTLGLALLPIIATIKSVIVVVKGLAVAFSFLAANPIGLIITALGLLSLGVYQVWKNWDDIKPKLLDYWENLKNKISGAIELIKNVLANFAEWIKPYAEILFFPLLLATDVFRGNWEGSLDRIKEFAKFILDLIKGFFGLFLDWTGPFGEKLNDAFGTMWEKIKESVLGIVTGLVDTVKGMFDGLLGFVGGTVDKVKGFASGIGSSVSGAVGKIGGLFGGERALGGPVSAGKTYLVGERGPELFTPGMSGGITPNNQMSGLGNVNISFNNVVINNEADENRLVEKIKSTLINQANNYNLGIS